MFLHKENPLASGLIAAIPFAEMGGLTLKDYTNRGNDAALNGGTWTGDPLGGSVKFNVNLGTMPASLTSGLTAISISFWMYNSVGSGTDIIAQWNDGAPGYSALISMSGTTDILFAVANADSSVLVRYGNTTGAVIGSTGLYHVVCTWKASGGTGDNNMHVYINGALQPFTYVQTTVVSALTASNAEPIALGGRYTQGATFVGNLNNVLFYNRELSASEVTQLYVDPWGLYQQPASWSYTPVPVVTGGRNLITSVRNVVAIRNLITSPRNLITTERNKV